MKGEYWASPFAAFSVALALFPFANLQEMATEELTTRRASLSPLALFVRHMRQDHPTPRAVAFLLFALAVAGTYAALDDTATFLLSLVLVTVLPAANFSHVTSVYRP